MWDGLRVVPGQPALRAFPDVFGLALDPGQIVERIGAVHLAGMRDSVLFIPGALLTLGAGVLFGVAWGTVYACVAAKVAAGVPAIGGALLGASVQARRRRADGRLGR